MPRFAEFTSFVRYSDTVTRWPTTGHHRTLCGLKETMRAAIDARRDKLLGGV